MFRIGSVLTNAADTAVQLMKSVQDLNSAFGVYSKGVAEDARVSYAADRIETIHETFKVLYEKGAKVEIAKMYWKAAGMGESQIRDLAEAYEEYCIERKEKTTN